MYVCSKKSRSKVIHTCQCPYSKRIDPHNTVWFATLEEAREAGYHLCSHCAPIGRYYRKEYYSIKKYAIKNGLIFKLCDGVIIIQTPYSKWKIVTAGKKNHIFLYHKNTRERKTDRSPIPGYHSQSVRRSAIMEYMEYIVKHDKYRLHNPENMPKPAAEPPKKGTKRYKKELKKQKRRQRYEGIKRVLTLIENEEAYRKMAASDR